MHRHAFEARSKGARRKDREAGRRGATVEARQRAYARMSMHPVCINICTRKRKGALWPLMILGGDKGVRTPDLMTASHALSQLSYTPIGESYSNRFRRKMQVFSRENLKITAMTENTVRASAFWQKNRVRFCENGVCQTARICDKIQKTAIGCWQNACFRYDVPKQDQRRKEDCT